MKNQANEIERCTNGATVVTEAGKLVNLSGPHYFYLNYYTANGKRPAYREADAALLAGTRS